MNTVFKILVFLLFSLPASAQHAASCVVADTSTDPVGTVRVMEYTERDRPEFKDSYRTYRNGRLILYRIWSREYRLCMDCGRLVLAWIEKGRYTVQEMAMKRAYELATEYEVARMKRASDAKIWKQSSPEEFTPRVHARIIPR